MTDPKVSEQTLIDLAHAPSTPPAAAPRTGRHRAEDASQQQHVSRLVGVDLVRRRNRPRTVPARHLLGGAR